MAGDKHVLVSYGSMVLDLNLRMRVHALETQLLAKGLPGIVDTVPGVRSLMVQYNPRVMTLQDVVNQLEAVERELPDARLMTVKSRVFNLPMAFHDSVTQDAIARCVPDMRSLARATWGLARCLGVAPPLVLVHTTR